MTCLQLDMGAALCRWRRFILRHRAQVLEVLTKYGEICEASFDMDFPAIADEDMEDTFMLARQLAPNTLFRGRGAFLHTDHAGLGIADCFHGVAEHFVCGVPKMAGSPWARCVLARMLSLQAWVANARTVAMG